MPILRQDGKDDGSSGTQPARKTFKTEPEAERTLNKVKNDHDLSYINIFATVEMLVVVIAKVDLFCYHFLLCSACCGSYRTEAPSAISAIY